MTDLKRYGIGLLLAGIGLTLGSCVPLAQTLWSAQTGAVNRVALSPGGAPAVLELARDLTAAPVVLIEPYPGAVDAAGETLTYSFSMRNASAGESTEETGTADIGRGQGTAPRGPAVLRLRFRERTIPAGRWLVRLDVGDGAALIRDAGLRLRPAGGLMPALLTTLVLAILGWLTASLGALQWIRSEAAHPAAPAPGTARDEQVRRWVVGCHLSALLGYLLPFGHLLGPLAVWLAKRHALPGVEATGRKALNFQLSATLYVLAGLLLSFFLIGVLVLFALVVFHFAVVLYAALRAQRGLDVNYPLSIRFI